MNRKKFIIKGISCVPVVASLVSFARIQPEFPGNKMHQPNQEDIPAFNDARSKKVIFVAHCVLNQNARLNQYATTPSAIGPVVQELLKREIGIIQLPCPETQLLGLGRTSDDAIYHQLSDPVARKALKDYANQVLELVVEYRKWNFKVLGILGNEGSPGCGVNLHYDEGQKPGAGAFFQELQSSLESCDPPVRIMGIEDVKTAEAMKIIDQWDND
jgi:predicted secreted protein